MAMLLMTGNFPNFQAMASGITPPASQPPAPPPPPSSPPPTTPPPSSPPPSSGACAVNYEIVGQWNTGFHANITIVNRGSTAISGYTLRWTFVSGERIASGWNANYVQNSNAVTASNPADNWNGTIAANGGSLVFGFIGNGTASRPAGFTLNGTPCS